MNPDKITPVKTVNKITGLDKVIDKANGQDSMEETVQLIVETLKI